MGVYYHTDNSRFSYLIKKFNFAENDESPFLNVRFLQVSGHFNHLPYDLSSDGACRNYMGKS